VLIDISGSMKHNDPNNLRVPAMRLLIDLLPTGSRAGVWTFGRYVHPIVPVATVTSRWRKRASLAAKEINSRGLFTNIGAALKAATADWREADPSTRRTLILLTDGMVDISKKPGANDAARKRIVDGLLPQLRDAGVTIHTVALSQHADKDLLRQMAQTTDGSFREADSAQQLQRIFLHLFEQSVHRDTLPLKDNRFQVDASVKELTLLAFHASGAPPTRLLAPSGKRFDANNAPANVRWHHEAGYDMVTIEKPEPGRWQLQANSDPDNRVMIVTNLKLQVSDLPNNILSGEHFPLKIRLTEKGQTITRQDFLHLLAFRVTQKSRGKSVREWTLRDNGMGEDVTANDGVYTLGIGPGLPAGEQTFAIQVDGKTFQRQVLESVNVYDHAFDVSPDPLPPGKGYGFRITVKPKLTWIDPKSLQIGAMVSDPTGTVRQMSAVPTDGGAWAVNLTKLDPKTSYTASLEVTGKTVNGRPIDVKLAPVTLNPKPIPKSAEAASTAASATSKPAKTAHNAQQRKPRKRKKGVNWILVGVIIVTGNIALFGIIGLIYYLMSQKKRSVPSFGDEEPPEPEPEPESEPEPTKA